MLKKLLLKVYNKPPVYFKGHIRAYRLKRKSLPIFDKYLKSSGPKKLQIGCGSNIIDGWLNTDLNFQKNRISYLDAGKKFPLPANVFDYIYSEHIFEHLTFAQGLNMLTECYRVLKPGGRLRLATPDFDFLIKIYTEPDKELHKNYIKWSTDRYIKEIARHLHEDEYSAAFVVNNFFRDWGHEHIYNYEGLELLLKKAGFIDMSRQKAGISKIEVFNQLERHGDIIPAAFNELETVVVEAKKGD